VEDIAAQVSKLSPDELLAMIKGITDFRKLEEIGKVVNLQQAQAILESLAGMDKNDAWKLSLFL